MRELRAAGAATVFREVASGARTDRPQLRRLLSEITAGDVVMVTRLDRLARSTRDLLNTLAAITEKKAGFRSVGDTWADTTTAHGRLMLTVLGGMGPDKYDASSGRHQVRNPSSSVPNAGSVTGLGTSVAAISSLRRLEPAASQYHERRPSEL